MKILIQFLCLYSVFYSQVAIRHQGNAKSVEIGYNSFSFQK